MKLARSWGWALRPAAKRAGRLAGGWPGAGIRTGPRQGRRRSTGPACSKLTPPTSGWSNSWKTTATNWWTPKLRKTSRNGGLPVSIPGSGAPPKTPGEIRTDAAPRDPAVVSAPPAAPTRGQWGRHRAGRSALPGQPGGLGGSGSGAFDPPGTGTGALPGGVLRRGQRHVEPAEPMAAGALPDGDDP